VRVPRLAVALSLRQLGQMLQAGVHLLRALEALTEQASSSELAEIWWTVHKTVAGGAYLSRAMSPFGHVFTPNVIRMVRVGETTGAMVSVLIRLADWLEHQENLRRRVASAMAYPILVLLVSVGISLGLVHFVLPPFLDVLVSLRLELPWPTRVLMTAATLVRHPGPWLMLLGAALLARHRLAQWWRTGPARLRLYAWSQRVPLLHGCLRDYACVRLSAAAAQLLSSGVDVVQAWTLALQASGDPRLEGWARPLQAHLLEGEEVHRFFRAQRLVPRLLPAMLEAGERSGRVPQMLQMTSALLEESLHSELALFTAVLQPLLLSLVSGVLVFLMVALFLPIYSHLSVM
jgi:type II secretory pathway component PulF